ncbi:MAG: nucleotidyltransferase domain-containing protein, partial [Methylobacter sp.]|nr:nucleotidyltransferase domain-containing protein [Methylobacter sp.]
RVIELLKNHTMRLSTKELQALRAIMGELDPAGRIYLYGSRADDTRRGGDIDLYLQASRPIDLKARLLAQYRMQQACDTRVDLLVKNPAQPELPLHQIAVERGVLL